MQSESATANLQEADHAMLMSVYIEIAQWLIPT